MMPCNELVELKSRSQLSSPRPRLANTESRSLKEVEALKSRLSPNERDQSKIENK